MFSLTSDSRSKLSDKELVERYRYSLDTAYIGVLFQRYTHLLFRGMHEIPPERGARQGCRDGGI
jgi:hypothetical protein